MLTLVVAYARNGVIGRDGGLPWHLPGDMKHFREVTGGGTVLMGRKTYMSIPEKFRPLPGRRNVVLSASGASAPGAEVFSGLESALVAAPDAFVIGGGTVYEEILPLADAVWATEIDADVEGDTFFPALEAADWVAASSSEPVSENGFTYRFVRYERS
ncbi:dihydrofolate reductase [Conexibacter woesei]|uniref:dihydrofolate reductase n=1 Tax=Conexibacter woesei TaxID=191495 RepID=UPI00042A569A|nr:dihydrofolate reductase [Conexibacter woesei]